MNFGSLDVGEDFGKIRRVTSDSGRHQPPACSGAVAQLVRVPDCRSGGCGFEPRRPRLCSPMHRFLRCIFHGGPCFPALIASSTVIRPLRPPPGVGTPASIMVEVAHNRAGVATAPAGAVPHWFVETGRRVPDDRIVVVAASSVPAGPAPHRVAWLSYCPPERIPVVDPSDSRPSPSLCCSDGRLWPEISRPPGHRGRFRGLHQQATVPL
jgi:hypothetical protein